MKKLLLVLSILFSLNTQAQEYIKYAKDTVGDSVKMTIHILEDNGASQVFVKTNVFKVVKMKMTDGVAMIEHYVFIDNYALFKKDPIAYEAKILKLTTLP